jgi:hypothetical protein
MTYRDDFKQMEREAWWTAPRVVLATLVLIVILYALGFIVTGGDLAIYRFWAPKQEAARREVYEHTKSYHQGSVQRLGTLCLQVNSADDDHKAMINDIIAQEFAEWDTADVPAHLRGCLATARAK